MIAENFSEKMKEIQSNVLDYLDDDDKNEEYLQIFFDNFKIQNNQYILKSLLYMLTKISNNHHREDKFFNKIERILQLIKDDMTKFFSNSALFNIFKSSKRLLLFLLENKILKFDEIIVKQILTNKYLKNKYLLYFQPEIDPFINEKWFLKSDEKGECEEDYYRKNSWDENFQKIHKETPDISYELYILYDYQEEIPEDFFEKRKIGDNDNYVCKLIQKDLIDDFVIYVTKNSNVLNSTINPSLYETNSFLIKNDEISLIEYAAFYGSIQIFNFLKFNNVEFTPSLWIYAIHGKNPEIIHILEELEINPLDDNYEILLKEAIKCHHNDIADYILNNYIRNEENISTYSIKYYNFQYIDFNSTKTSSFCDLCKYDFFLPVQFLIQSQKIDINQISTKEKFIEEEVIKEKENITISTFIPYDQNKMTIKKTALHYAVEKENIDIIQLLLNIDNIDVNKKTFESFNTPRYVPYDDWYRKKMWYDKHNTSTERTALYIAIEKNNPEIVKLLLNHKNIDVNILSFVRTAVLINEDNNADLTTEKTALQFAVEKGNLEIIQQLLNHRNINVNAISSRYGIEFWYGYGGGNDDIFVEYTPLHTAVEKENSDIVKLLLSNENINVNITYNLRITEYYRYGALFDDSIKTALFMAVEKSNANIIQLLLSNNNININMKSKFKQVYIKESERDGFDKAYKYAEIYYKMKWGLIKYNKDEENNEDKYDESEEEDDDDIDVSSRKFITPLQLAEKEKEYDIIKLLTK